MSVFPKRALAAALVVGMAAGALPASALAKPGPDHGHPAPGHPAPGGKWGKGQHFDARYAPHYQVVDYHSYHHLTPPPRGYHWVRSGNDAVLVAIGTGIVASVIANGMLN